MQEEVKSVISVVVASEKLSSFNNWLITSPKLTVDIQFLQESVIGQEKETICITKWLNQVSLKLTAQDQDVLWSTDKWI
jgi:hypothetical protein